MNWRRAAWIVLVRWTLTPRASYDITARILGRDDDHFDPVADLSPLDLALGWGPMSDNPVLQALRISQGAGFFHGMAIRTSLTCTFAGGSTPRNLLLFSHVGYCRHCLCGAPE